MYTRLLSILLISFPIGFLYGQTCCSGGVPISNALGLPYVGKNSLQLKLSYDYNNLSTLLQGDEKLNDDTRTRVTHTALFQVGAPINDRITVEFLLPFIKQDRSIVLNGEEDFISSNGIGDIMALGTFNFLKNDSKSYLSLSLGIKAPTGATDNKNNQGIILNADMQSGTGSWDYLTMARFIRSFRNNSFYSSVIANFKGTNPDYLPNLSYQFGNEQQVSIGLSHQTTLLKSLWDLGAGLRFRNVMTNKVNEQTVPSTSGKWLLGSMNMSYWLKPGQTSLNIGADVPLYAVVSGLQNVPTYRLNISLYSLINWGKSEENPFEVN